MARALLMALVAGMLAAGACSPPPGDPLELEGSRLTVHNRTSEDWTNVEIWLNHQFRLTVRRIEAGSRFQTSLNNLVEGYGRRFDFARMQIRDLRLKAERPDGEPFELVKAFRKDGLAGVFGGTS